MKLLAMVPIILMASIFIAGCRVQENISKTSTDLKLIENPPKEGDTIISGNLVERNGVYVIVETAGVETMVDSYSYDLSEYVGQDVIISGQYSGDTLFAGEVIVNE